MLSIQRVCSWLSACELANSQMMAHGFSILQNFSSSSTILRMTFSHVRRKKSFQIAFYREKIFHHLKCSTVDLSKSANCMKFWTCKNRICVYRNLINILWAHIKHHSRRQNQTFLPQHLHRAKELSVANLISFSACLHSVQRIQHDMIKWIETEETTGWNDKQ